MKDIYAVGLGVAAFAAGCAAVGVMSAGYVKGIDDKVTGLSKGMKYIQDNVDISIPSEVGEEMVRLAANEVAGSVVNKAAEAAKKEISNEISKQVKSAVANAYTTVQADVQHQLEAQINLQTIEKIQNTVAEKVAKQVFDKALFLGTNDNSKENIIKTCVANGMDAWEIRRILEATK